MTAARTLIFGKMATIFGSRMLTRGSQVVAFALLARALSPAGLGIYGVLTSAVFLAGQIGNLGFRQAAAYRMGRGEMTAGEVMGAIALFWPIASCICVSILLVLNAQALGQLGRDGPLSFSLALGAATAAALFLTLIQSVYLGNGHIRAFAITDAGPRLLQSIFIVLLSLFGTLALITALWSFAAGFMLIVPLALWMALKEPTTLRVPVRLMPGMVRQGFLFAASMFLIAFQPRVGVFYLSATSGGAEAGEFFAAQRASEIFLEAATAVGLVLFSETVRSSSTEGSLRNGLRTASALFLMFLGAGALVAWAAPMVVTVLLGPAYNGATEVLQIIALGLAPAAFTRVMNSVVAGLGRPWLSGSVVLVGVLVNIAGCIVLSPRLGPSGVALALVAGQTVSACLYFIIAYFGFGARLR